MFWNPEPPAAPSSAQPVSPPWQTLVLVCEKCKGSRRGPDSHGIRKGLKQRVGKSKLLRVIEAPCMNVCPDDAVTVCIARSKRPTEVLLVRAESELDALAASLER